MNIQEIVLAAKQAANEAGERWVAENTDGVLKPGVMYDYCGNAWVRFNDRRFRSYRQFKQANLIDVQTGVIEIGDKFSHRQEHGLRLACATAKFDTLKQLGVVGIEIWSYED